MEAVTILDELLEAGLPEKYTSLVEYLLDNSETVIVASSNDCYIIRGKLKKEPPRIDTTIGGHKVVCDEGVFILVWREGFTYNYVVIVGRVGERYVCGTCHSDS